MIRACALSLLLVLLSGCATGKDSFYQQWRDGSTGERALMVLGGACMVGLMYLVYHVSADDGEGPALGSTGEPCVGDCRPPPTPGVCFMGQDTSTGAPCRW